MKKWQIIAKAFKHSYLANPGLFISGITFGIIHSLFYVLFTFSMQRFFDSLEGDSIQLQRCFLLFIGLGVVTLFREIFNGLHNYCGSAIRQYTTKYNHKLVLQAVQKYAPIDFEDIHKLDEINRACEGADHCYNFVDTFLDIIDFYLPYFIFLSLYLWNLLPQMVILVIVIFIPVFLNTIIKTRLFEQHENTAAVLRRRHEGFLSCFLNLNQFRESKGMGIFEFLNFKRKEALEHYQEEKMCVNIQNTKVEVSMQIITLLGYFGGILYLAHLLKTGQISVGCFAAIFASLEIFFDMMRLAVYINLGSAFQNLASVKNFILFVDEQKDAVTQKPMSIEEIELQSVDFSYVKEKKILQNINLKLRKNEILAVVGENGMGKSTLARILCGVYVPESGKILINGNSENAPEILRENATALFQDFQKYKMTLGENVSFSSEDQKSVLDALTKAGVPEEFMHLETLLGREFGGRDFSGGQWQRIALARCIYKNVDLIVLDEPTSAIDPLEETKLYHNFKEIMCGKIGVIITHRIGAARLADKIIVMKDGMIAEYGTHEELMQAGKIYYGMFCAQAQSFESKD